MANIEDFVPFLQIFPSPKLRRAKRVHKELVAVYSGLFKEFKLKIANGTFVGNCIVKELITTDEADNLDELDEIMLIAAFIIGGTITVSIQTFETFTRLFSPKDYILEIPY